MRTHHTPALHAYLSQQGLLHSTDTLALERAKKQYWRAYRRNWQHKKRQEQKSFTIFCTKHELAIFKNASKAHKLSITTLIKQTSLAYLKQQFIVPNSASLDAIKETLSLMLSSIIHALDEERIPDTTAKELLEKIKTLEQTILIHFESPKLQS